MGKKILCFLFFLLAAGTANAVKLYGTVYDSSFDQVSNVVIYVNSTPAQRFVAKDGTFLFSLPIGDYNIRAELRTPEQIYVAEENISVTEVTGEYVMDLNLPTALIKANETEVEVVRPEPKKRTSLFHLGSPKFPVG